MKILILGDIILDINYICTTNRQAPEAPIPVYNIKNINYILGGAANIANNLHNLKCDTEIISVIGNDEITNKYYELFKENNIKHTLFIDLERKNTQKHRLFCDNLIKTRFDIEDTHDITIDFSEKIINYIKLEKNNDIDAIIISDYNKGVVTTNLCEKIIEYCNNNNIYTFIDPKNTNVIKYKNCFCFKPNLLEGMQISNNNDILNILDFIKLNINCQNIILTCGKDGLYVNNIENYINYNSDEKVIDVTGAGDIVICVLTFMFIKTKDLILSSKIANFIACKSVRYIGNYKLSINDINDYYELYNNKIIYDYEIDKIKQLSINKNLVFTNGCFDILHSAHIKLLKFAKKQGDILIVGLNSDESIKRLKGDTRPINNLEERMNILSQFDFIDYIIVFNNDTPLDILELLKPNILIKGGDYKKEDIIGSQFVNNILLFDFIKNKSTSLIVDKIKQK